MISSFAELQSKLVSIHCGESMFQLEVTDGHISFRPEPFIAPIAFRQSEYWLDQTIGVNLVREFSRESKTWILKPIVLNRISSGILSELTRALVDCLDSKAPERTSLYKEYRVINDMHTNNPAYITDIIGILNYYHSSKTDVTCKSNIIGLLTILRKKYGTPSGSKS